MRIIVCTSHDDIARVGADIIESQLFVRPRPVLGLATGSSPLPIYRRLGERVRAGEISFESVHAFALDEYVGLDPEHPQSYHRVIKTEVTEPLQLDPAAVRVPGSHHTDEDVLAKDAAEFEEAIKDAGGVDIQILGIGRNGHIAFNEPGSAFDSRTRVTDLTVETCQDNARFFTDDESVPTKAVTQGIGTIYEARSLLMVALGESKAEAVHWAIDGPPTTAVPASALQQHPHFTVLLDEAAASQLAAPIETFASWQQ